MVAASLYEVRKVDDEWDVSCVVITRTGQDSAGEVHNGMECARKLLRELSRKSDGGQASCDALTGFSECSRVREPAPLS